MDGLLKMQERMRPLLCIGNDGRALEAGNLGAWWNPETNIT
jgi:hypothetical protein